MEIPYTYIPSPDYINNLAFEYIETYSFQRGKNFEENLQLIKSEYEELQIRKQERSDFSSHEEERLAELHALLGFTQYLINDSEQFHPSAKKINTFQFTDPAVSKLTDILTTEIRDIPRWLCAPLYRDAIVFYDRQHKIVSVLNICLSCQHMETKMFNHIDADYETYDLLKRYFIDIGHDVEEPTKFVLDDLKKLKEKDTKTK